MNIDIKTQFHPKNPTPMTVFQVKSAGSLHNPAETAKKLKDKYLMVFQQLVPTLFQCCSAAKGFLRYSD
jgi:hypothetical protein